MTTKALIVPNWNRYEKADGKKCRTMQWVAVPIAHDGLGYIEIMSHPDGIRMIGGWLLVLQVAARCPVRGLLVSDSGRVLRAREIALKTRAQESDISSSIVALVANGWLQEIEAEEAIRMVSARRPDSIRTTGQDRTGTGQDITGQGQGAGAPPPPTPPGTELLAAALKACHAAGGKPNEREALGEWIALLTNEVRCRDDDECAQAATYLIKAAKRDGITARYARQVEDRIEAARCHIKAERREKNKVA